MIIIVHTDTVQAKRPHRIEWFFSGVPRITRAVRPAARGPALAPTASVYLSRALARVAASAGSSLASRRRVGRRVSGSLASPLRRSLSTVSRVEPPPYQLATQHAVRFRSAQCTAHLISTPTYFLCTLTDCPTEDSPLVRAALPGFATPWLRCACSGSSPSLSCAPFHAAPPAL